MPGVRNEMTVQGLDGAAPFPEDLHTLLGELSASGNCCLLINFQTDNATEYAQPLENWVPLMEQGAGSRGLPKERHTGRAGGLR